MALRPGTDRGLSFRRAAVQSSTARNSRGEFAASHESEIILFPSWSLTSREPKSIASRCIPLRRMVFPEPCRASGVEAPNELRKKSQSLLCKVLHDPVPTARTRDLSRAAMDDVRVAQQQHDFLTISLPPGIGRGCPHIVRDDSQECATGEEPASRYFAAPSFANVAMASCTVVMNWAGKMIVEFFSVEISAIVCSVRSWSATGCCEMMSAASPSRTAA